MLMIIKQRATKLKAMIMRLMISVQKINVIESEAKLNLEKLSPTNSDATGSCTVLTSIIAVVVDQSVAAKTFCSKKPRVS